MASDHTVYLSSSGCRELFPENNTSMFINRISTPILLDSKTEYEVGLVSILCPDKYYAVLADDDKYNIKVNITQSLTGSHSFLVKMKKNVLAGDMEKIIHFVNKNLILYMKTHLHGFFPYVFSNETILSWNDDEDKTELNFFTPLEPKNVGDIVEISIRMYYGLASVLGFRSDMEYSIFNKFKTAPSKHLSFRSPPTDCGIEHLYIYTDIVHPTNFAGQLTNILDCFTLNNKGNKGFHNTVYKHLNTNVIDQISIIITDQKGRKIPFSEESTLVLLLHIRER